MVEAIRPRHKPDVETHILPDGSCLLFDPDNDRGYALNAAGALVWDYCDGELTGAEITQEMADLLPQYGDMRQVTEELLRELLDLGLIAADAATAGQQGERGPEASQ